MSALLSLALLVSNAAAAIIIGFGTSTQPSFLDHYGGLTKPAARDMTDKEVLIQRSKGDISATYRKTSPGSTHYVYVSYITSQITENWYKEQVGAKEGDAKGRESAGNTVARTDAATFAYWGPWSWKHVRGWYTVEPNSSKDVWHRNPGYTGPDFSEEQPEALSPAGERSPKKGAE
ncbi:hypothetical protein PpBr36_08916 [Pyricularia pennisetigena]|uniref:hypothetical protein n=1 Tax=Pyricularia pennisetigena TaxID=1578925 RepID=UPI00114E2158|nr:hypothetical protein PpBr36_08916 [Pyricularia pennisetigena]TLS24248.1 hypothetical protein PpBr36_08916 [Pyricularia pennisetigena]